MHVCILLGTNPCRIPFHFIRKEIINIDFLHEEEEEAKEERPEIRTLPPFFEEEVRTAASTNTEALCEEPGCRQKATFSFGRKQAPVRCKGHRFPKMKRYLGSLGWEGVENEEYGISWTVNGPQQELVDSYKEMLPVLLERIQEEAQRARPDSIERS